MQRFPIRETSTLSRNHVHYLYGTDEGLDYDVLHPAMITSWQPKTSIVSTRTGTSSTGNAALRFCQNHTHKGNLVA